MFKEIGNKIDVSGCIATSNNSNNSMDTTCITEFRGRGLPKGGLSRI